VGAASFRSVERLSQAAFECWLDDFAPELGKCELIHGHIVRSPPATYRHGGTGMRLGTRLGAYVEQMESGTVFDASTGFELPTGDTLEPDLAYVSASRLRRGPKPSRSGFLRAVPSLVVEILSPSTRSRDLRTKRGIYERSGVSEYWVIDTERRTVRAFRRVHGGFAEPRVYAASEGDLLRSTAVRGFVVAVADLFLEI